MITGKYTVQPNDNDLNIPYTFYEFELVSNFGLELPSSFEVASVGGVDSNGDNVELYNVDFLEIGKTFAINVEKESGRSDDSRITQDTFVILSNKNFVDITDLDFYDKEVLTSKFIDNTKLDDSILMPSEIFLHEEIYLGLANLTCEPEFCLDDGSDPGYTPPSHTSINNPKTISVNSITNQSMYKDDKYYFKVSFEETGWYSIYSFGIANTKGQIHNTSGVSITPVVYDNGTGRGEELTSHDQMYTSYYGKKGFSIIIMIQAENNSLFESTSLHVSLDNYSTMQVDEYHYILDSINSGGNILIHVLDTEFKNELLLSMNVWNELEPLDFQLTNYTGFGTILDFYGKTNYPDGMLGEYVWGDSIRYNANVLGDYSENVIIKVFVHELGHSIGIGHVDSYEALGNQSVMWSVLDLNQNPVDYTLGPVDVALYKYIVTSRGYS